jgi:hypothetical protein
MSEIKKTDFGVGSNVSVSNDSKGILPATKEEGNGLDASTAPVPSNPDAQANAESDNADQFAIDPQTKVLPGAPVNSPPNLPKAQNPLPEDSENQRASKLLQPTLTAAQQAEHGLEDGKAPDQL